tara:strand:- start:1132 stop:2160 length:1029 start_codon:yes stop_codon:yes gene_type:complete
MLLKEFHAMSSKKETITYKVSIEELGLRLDQFLSNNISNLSRSRIKHLINEGNVFKVYDNKHIPVEDPSKKVTSEEIYYINIPEPIDPKPIAQEIPLEILYEDKDLIVINKPIGLVVHPAPGNYDNTLVNALIAHCGESLSGIGGEKKPGIVHRLDKDTSGVMVIAKNDSTHESLSEQFANHGRDGKLIRSYKALVWGIPNIQSGKIETFIGRSDKNRKKMAVYKEEKKGRRFAITHWKRIKFNKELDISKIQCNLETGRTHQIRVHLTHIGLPVIGDQVYGTGFKSKLNKYDDGIRNILLNASKKQSLHAYKLGFEHPTSKKNMLFETNLPHAMQEVSDIL